MFLNRHYKESSKNKIMFVIDKKLKTVLQFFKSKSVYDKITVRF